MRSRPFARIAGIFRALYAPVVVESELEATRKAIAKLDALGEETLEPRALNLDDALKQISGSER